MVADKFLDKLNNEDKLPRASRKAGHFKGLLDNIGEEIEERVWNLCRFLRKPLQSDDPEELATWVKYNKGEQIPPGFIPPQPTINSNNQYICILNYLLQESADNKPGKESGKPPSSSSHERWDL